MKIRNGVLGQFVAATVSGLMVFAGLRLPRAHAHAERAHGIAVMMALEYLAHRATAHGDADAGAAVGFWNDFLGATADSAAATPTGPLVLGLEPEVVVSASDTATREEPGLCGPLEDPNPDREFPVGDGALLAYLVASVDDHADVWGDAKSPFQFMTEQVDESIDNLGTGLMDGWAHDVGDGPGSDLVCADPDGFFEVLGCALFDILFWVFELNGAPIVALNTLILGADSDNIKEGIVEDAVSGCDLNTFGGKIIDQIIEQSGEALSEIEKDQLADDGLFFYPNLGISFASCDTMEEALEDIQDFRLYGSPTVLGHAIFNVRARLADWILACDKDGVNLFDDDQTTDVEQCVDDPTLVAAHFRAMEPWALSAEGVERTPAASEFWRRWVTDQNFTTLTHFEDVLSPIDGTTVDFSDPAVTVDVMKAPHGQLHPYDGYSLGKGGRFTPVPAALASLELTPTDKDEEIVKQSNNFDLRLATPATGHLILRRRVCAPGLAGLTTDDGLGFSQCGPGGAVPSTYVDPDHSMMEQIFPPAELGALDGFTLWTHAQLAPQLVDATTQLAYTYFDSFLPFLILQEDNGGVFPAATPFTCTSPIDCAGNAPRYAQWITDLLGTASLERDAMRLRGMATALHMVQDMTVPHHLAPTTAFGHGEYESWFSAYFFPQKKQITALDAVSAFVPSVGSGGWDSAGTGTATNRWLLDVTDGGAGWKTTDELWAEMLGILDTSASFHFNDEVDAAYDLLAADMAALLHGSACDGKFSVRALTRAVAFETARIVHEEGRLAPITGGGLDGTGMALGGFWIMSAIAIANGGAEVPTWRAVGRRTAPLMVAASAHLLMAGARAYGDPSTTCDGGEDDGPALEGSTPASFTGPTCDEQRRAEILACFQDPTGAGCAQYEGLAGYDTCSGAAGPYADDECGQVALALAACACRAAGIFSIDDQHAAVNECLDGAGRRARVRDLERSGEIDGATARYLVGEGGTDRDRDGIPDASDDCPTKGSGVGVWPDTTLDIGVCWKRAEARGACAYGCPVDTGNPNPRDQ